MKDASHQKVKLQRLEISEKWTVRKHEFYAIDPERNIANEDAFWMFSEDLLQIELNGYVLDLGWYGDEDGSYCIYLIRGHFLTGELLEKFKSKDRKKTVERLESLIAGVERGQFDDISGYLVTEDNQRMVDDFENYSCL